LPSVLGFGPNLKDLEFKINLVGLTSPSSTTCFKRCGWHLVCPLFFLRRETNNALRGRKKKKNTMAKFFLENLFFNQFSYINKNT
jgi:hypothetical protein